MLIGADNSLADPWLVSQIVIQSTESLCPLVAVQPVHMHPYSVAKAVSTLAFLYGRRVFLNIVAGGFKSDLAALSDTAPRNRKYERLVEYTRIVQQLLNGRGPVTFDGKFYSVTNLTLRPALPAEMHPGILISGSPEAGMAAARETGAIAVLYPEPPRSDNPRSLQNRGRYGVRVGIITRPRGEDAWASAQARFPEDQGRLNRQPATRTSDSRDTYWVYPFENYQTNCPYLVGSYQSVAEELARYAANGYRTFVLDIPPAREEFEHIGKVFQTASRKTAGVAV
jgi:alkanesulfonate monooxygenase